jgi:hypothetical protein
LALGRRRGPIRSGRRRGVNRSSRRGRDRNSLGSGRGCEIEFDLDWFARFDFREFQDPTEEAVPNSIAM